MIRKQIYIAAEQEQVLKSISAQTGMTEAEIVRKAIDLWAQVEGKKQKIQASWQRIQEFILERSKQNSVIGERTWTRESLYEERINRANKNSD